MKSARSRFTGLRFRVAFFFAFSIIIYIWLVYYCHFYCINNKYFGHKIRKSRSLKSHDDHPQSNILFCKIGKSIRTYYVRYLWWERKSAGSFFIWVIFFWWSISSLDNRYNKVTTLHTTSDCVFALLFLLHSDLCVCVSQCIWFDCESTKMSWMCMRLYTSLWPLPCTFIHFSICLETFSVIIVIVVFSLTLFGFHSNFAHNPISVWHAFDEELKKLLLYFYLRYSYFYIGFLSVC